MKPVRIEVMLSREEASELREMLDRHIGVIQYLESNQPQNLREHVDQERNAVIALQVALENSLREASVADDGLYNGTRQWLPSRAPASSHFPGRGASS